MENKENMIMNSLSEKVNKVEVELAEAKQIDNFIRTTCGYENILPYRIWKNIS